MTQSSRGALLARLGQVAGYPVIAYVTGDREGMQTQIGPDQLVLFPRHLTTIGRQDHLGLLLYTRGGDANVPWPLVTYLREQCNRLTVLIPFSAHSSGTLLSLGADEIVMTQFSTLSPIDPTVANAFNPSDPANPSARFPIAVEDVLAYLEFVKENVAGNAYDDAFRRLTESVHPLALGNVKRSINQIRELAKRLINLHPPAHTEDELTALVTRLTTELYSHQHYIGRREAADIGLPIAAENGAIEQLLLDYYHELEVDLELREPFNPPNMLRVANPAPAPAPPVQIPGTTMSAPPTLAISVPQPIQVVLERAYVETASTSDAFRTRGEISVHQLVTPQGPQNAVALEVFSEKWEVVA